MKKKLLLLSSSALLSLIFSCNSAKLQVAKSSLIADLQAEKMDWSDSMHLLIMQTKFADSIIWDQKKADKYNDYYDKIKSIDSQINYYMSMPIDSFKKK